TRLPCKLYSRVPGYLSQLIRCEQGRGTWVCGLVFAVCGWGIAIRVTTNHKLQTRKPAVSLTAKPASNKNKSLSLGKGDPVMFVLRPSSSFGAAPVRPIEADAAPAAPVLAEPIGEPNGKPYIDEGLPVPEGYGVDIVRALLQDPFRVFIYWDVRPKSLEGLTRIFPEAEAAEFRTTLKLRDMDGGQEALFPVSARGRYWMMVFPARTYEFEIGVRSPRHGYISLARSNQVTTPRGTVSPELAPEPEYQLTAPQFIDVLQASGFAPEQAM